MKKKLGILSLLAITALVPTACGDKSDNSNNNGENQTTESLQEKKDAAKAELKAYADAKLAEANVEDTENTVSAIVERFNNEVNSLNSVADIDSKLTIAKTAVDSAVAAYKSLKDQEELKALKADSKTQLELYTTKKLADNNLTIDVSITAAVNAGKSLIDSANSIDAVKNELTDAKANVDAAIETILNNNQSQALANYKVTKRNEIDQYKISKLNDNNLDETSTLTVIANAAKSAIDSASTIDAVDEAVTQGKANIDAEITKMINAKALKTAKEAAKLEISQYVINKAEAEGITDLTDMQAVANNASSSIDNATSESEINTIVTNAKAAIDSIIADYKSGIEAAEALAQYKITKANEIEESAETAISNASVTDDGSVSSLVNLYKNKINVATSIENVDSIVTEFNTKLTEAINVIVANKELATEKEKAKTEIENYATSKLGTVGLTDTASVQVVTSKVNTIKSEIDNQTSVSAINTTLTTGKETIDSTIQELLNMSEEDKLSQAKTTAKTEIETYASNQLSINNLTDDGTVDLAVGAGKTAIEAANNIEEIEQAITTAKTAIDEKINALINAKKLAELNSAKENAINELNEYLTNKLTENSLTNTINITNEISLINSSTTIELVESNLIEAKKSVDEKIQAILDANKLSAYKATAIAELEGYVSTKLTENNLTSNQTIESLVNTHKGNINAATTIKDAQVALNNAKDAINEEISKIIAEALNTVKANAIATVSSYASEQIATNNVTDDGSVKAIVDSSSSRINACTTESAVNSMVATIKSEIDQAIGVLVDKQEQIIALNNLKKTTKEELLAYKNNVLSTNEITDDGTVNTAYLNGVSAIEAATSESEVQSALIVAKTNINNAANAIVVKELITLKQKELEDFAEEQKAANNVTDDGTIRNIVISGKEEIATKTTTADVLKAFTDAKTAVSQAIRDLKPVDDSIINKLSYTYAENETIAAEWSDSKAEQAVVEYKLSSASTWTVVDEELVRDQNGLARVDIVGLKGNETYDVRIFAGHGGTTMYMDNVYVSAYDRSGYAHFNNTEGVGAYNDDGTLKDNAIIVYVSDATKNTTTLTYGGITVSGIGNILNTVGQACGEAGHENECKKVASGKTYYGTANTNQGIIKKISDANIPLVIRITDMVSNTGLYKEGTFNASSKSIIEGLTEYNSVNYGGSVGDNGHMARIKSGKNITIEGIGNNAGMDGWGIHFMAETANPTYGKNFEMRNLTFMNTPEDAIGMEGIQEGTKITAGVERCWIHHNTFLAPSISNPAESDKSEGDGSCDFKRGQYFTMSYNYFEYCHKTNLVGSSDTSLQFNISFHHNMWYQCGSRIPLLRQANLHFYNNYVYSNPTDTKGALSYITSLRANCYMFSENNYFEGNKNVYDGKTGGTAKAFGNVYTGNYGEDAGQFDVTSRTATVSSSCSYDGTSYANFDTNSSLFYYDANKKVTDAYITDGVTARQVCMTKAGSMYRTIANKTTIKANTYKSNMYEVSDSIDLSSGSYTATLSSDKGILYTGASNGKFKGQGITFKLSDYATVTVSLSGGSSSQYPGTLVGSDGTVYLTASGSALLKPGTYYITSCQMDKETTVSQLSFVKYNSEELEKERIDAYNKLVDAIPSNIEYTTDCYNKISDAMNAYDTLGDLQSKVSYTKVQNAFNTYVNLGINNVEGLINAIGTVNENSYSAISAARNAYNQAITEVKNGVSNLSTLTAAETAYEEFAAKNVVNAINALASTSTATTRAQQEALLAEYNNVLAQYNALSSTQKASVTNISKLTNGIAELESSLAPYNVIDLINEIPATVTTADTATIKAARTAYDALNDSQKALVTNYEKLTAAEATLKEIASKTELHTFGGESTSSSVTVSGNTSTSKGSVTYNGTTYSTCLKMESSTSITVNAAVDTKLTLVFGGSTAASGKTVKIDGTAYTCDSNGIVTINISSGTHTITKGDTINLFVIQLG